MVDHTATYQTVIQLAKDKGYKPFFPTNPGSGELEAELHIIRVWLRRNHKKDIEEPGRKLNDNNRQHIIAETTKAINEITSKK